MGRGLGRGRRRRRRAARLRRRGRTPPATARSATALQRIEALGARSTRTCRTRSPRCCSPSEGWVAVLDGDRFVGVLTPESVYQHPATFVARRRHSARSDERPGNVAAATMAMDVADSLLDLVGNTPLVRLGRVGRDLAVRPARQGRDVQPRRQREGPSRGRDDRRRRARRPAAAGRHDRRADVGQHRRRPRHRRRAARATAASS